MSNQNTKPQQETNIDSSVNQLIRIGILTRLLVDTGVQFFFPFLPIVAQGLNVNTIVIGRLVSLRSATGLLSPMFGELADRKGYRLTMRLGLLLGSIGYAIVGFSQQIWTAAIGMFLAGVGTFAFVPTLQAYLSIKLPYHRRAWGLGVLEYAWALSGIFGLFSVGLLIEATNWRVPLFVISIGMLLATILYSRLPMTDSHQATVENSSTSPTRINRQQIRQFFDLGDNGRSAWASLISQGTVMFSAMHLFINYGSWLKAEYQFTPSRLGQVALYLGIADLVGSVLVSLIADRFGKRRSLLVGVSVAIVGFVILPLMNVSALTAVSSLIFVRFGFEFSVVSNIIVLSEQAPTQRGKIMTLGAACALLGSTLAGFTGPLAFVQFGIWGLSIIPAITMGIALLLIIMVVKE